MGRKPGLYSDIGISARGLLYGDYVHQPPIHYRFGYFDWSLHLLCEINKIVRGLTTVFRVVIPYQRSSRVELQYLHDYAGITMGVSMTKNPLVNFSCVLGTSLCNIGTAMSFDTLVGQLSKWDAGLSFNTAFLNAAVTLTEKGDALSASCYSNPLKRTAFATELTHRFKQNQTAMKLGGQHSLSDTTMVKARVGTDGDIGAAVQLECFSAFLLTIAGEINVKTIRTAKIGMSCSFSYDIRHHVFSSIGIPLNIDFQH
ncbi:hypothetical protein ACH5RR_007653 [Cinchona calisaya]|uniref:Uncharacterized protein n=1 Tax=Cinchona calisaya TaxID=153742 RepID=A0ABD3A942_9GENT